MFDGPVAGVAVSYGIEITREPWITFEEWQAVIASRKELRPQEGPSRIINPHTGAVISVSQARGDTELLFEGKWIHCFRWRDGDEELPSAIEFNAPRDWDSPGSSFRQLARDIARSLGARLVGQEDETYE